MKVNIFYKSLSESGNMGESHEKISSLSESNEQFVLDALQDLLKDASVMASVQENIGEIPDITERRMLQGTLNRMTHLDDDINRVHTKTQARLKQLFLEATEA